MTDGSKRGLSPERVDELIAEVSASDRRRARRAIADGVQAAQNQWIEAPLIVEALALELVAITQGNAAGPTLNVEVASYLRALAQTLETPPDIH